MVEHPDYIIEKEWLDYILAYLNDFYLRTADKKLSIDESVSESAKHYDPDNIEQYYELMLNIELQNSLVQKVNIARKSLKKPYFARVDFKDQNETETAKYYIGKMSLIRDEDLRPLIIDWRAPVSNLYYEGRIGEASYECPDGTISGDITLKRQYIIEDAKLNDFFDIDITASDEFLQAALGSSKDRRLKDIVSTIQAEQNKIIRADMHKPVIVQGAAGGGKTTIALHRIAYLLYNYESRISARNIMIIAPNRFFLSYISEVLPDLGVENVLQTTIEDFARHYVGTELKIKTRSDKLAFVINNPKHYQTVARVSRIKTSMNYRRMIENYAQAVTQKILPEKHFMLGGYVLYEYKAIRKMLCDDYSYLPVEKRIPEVRKYLVNALKKRKPEITADIIASYDKQREDLRRSMPDDTRERQALMTALLDRRDTELVQLERSSQSLVRDFFKDVTLETAEKLYTELILTDGLMDEAAERLIQPDDIKRVRSLSSQTVSHGSFEDEDIAPIMYLHYLFYGNTDIDLRHIVIDEAQDMGIFQMYVLRKMMNSNSFSILGDLCQGIYSYMGVTDWNDVANRVFNQSNQPKQTSGPRFMTLEQSYRTTVEIMDFANIAAAKLIHSLPEGTPLAKPVIRHGSEVRVFIRDSYADIGAGISERITEYQAMGYKSVAVICKTQDELLAMREHIDCPDMQVIEANDDDYMGGVVLVPAYLAKGLEFDGVIVADAGAENYGTTELELKLLYIAMTRALHELTIFARWNLCEALK